MKKGLRSTLYLKFIIIYLIFGFLCLFSAILLSTELINEPLTSVFGSITYKDATSFANDYLPGYFDEAVTKSEVRAQLKGLSARLNAGVWFVEPNGALISYASNSGLSLPPQHIEEFNPTELGTDQYTVGTYHNYFQTEVITVIVPVVYNYLPRGYLLVHKRTSDLQQIVDVLQKSVFFLTFLIYILSFLILLGFHFLVYHPLQNITYAATKYAKGDLDYVIPVNQDDEIGYISASLNYMASQIKDMEDYQKKFIANVSHDFRSPLTSIKGYITAMADGTIPPELYEKYLNIILFETERLTDLTQDLLTLNEFDTKNRILDKKSFDIHEIIKHVASSFEGTCTQKHISIELLFAKKQEFVFADQRKIQQVLYNLLDNAIKFSDPDSSITIETTERGDKLICAVKDSGPGIPRADVNKIWERFYKSDSSRGKDKKGTGLGLSIVKEAITAHGENINVISTEGVGTEFVFTLTRSTL